MSAGNERFALDSEHCRRVPNLADRGVGVDHVEARFVAVPHDRSDAGKAAGACPPTAMATVSRYRGQAARSNFWCLITPDDPDKTFAEAADHIIYQANNYSYS
jgi:hypothetical protein